MKRVRRSSRRLTFSDVREIGLQLPGAEEGTAYGSPALKVNGQMFACIPTHKSAEPNSLAVRIPFEQRDDLVAAEPDTYYLTPHYEDYPAVLVRLSKVHVDALRDILLMAHAFVAAKKRRRSHASRQPRP
jgi:hypothetical protein